MTSAIPRIMQTGILLVAFSTALWAQAAATPPAPPACTISKHAWSSKGELILGARISAGGVPLELGKISGSGAITAAGLRDERLENFTMATSVLVDLYTGKTIKPLPQLPKKPFLGTMDGIITLNPGDSLMFGVAFPHPPDPPPDKDGKPQDYRFELRVPDIPPVKFSIPFQPAG